jgi:hypothetical protein
MRIYAHKPSPTSLVGKPINAQERFLEDSHAGLFGGNVAASLTIFSYAAKTGVHERCRARFLLASLLYKLSSSSEEGGHSVSAMRLFFQVKSNLS